jgi:DNA-3-methyladenine glycosylase
MAERRGMAEDRREVSNGPGKLCRAFAIDRAQYGVDLCKGSLHLRAGMGFPAPEVLTSKRIGVDYAGPWSERPWRFFDRASAYVSPVRAGTKKGTKRTRSRAG